MPSSQWRKQTITPNLGPCRGDFFASQSWQLFLIQNYSRNIRHTHKLITFSKYRILLSFYLTVCECVRAVGIQSFRTFVASFEIVNQLSTANESLSQNARKPIWNSGCGIEWTIYHRLKWLPTKSTILHQLIPYINLKGETNLLMHCNGIKFNSTHSLRP